MSLILEYAYTHSVVVTEENVLELLAGADIFAVKGVMQACCNFLEGQLSFKNCIDIWRLANCHSCSDLMQKAYLYILHHFEEVAGLSANFLHLSVEQLADFIEKDELSVRQESAVFEAILRWINYAPEERRGHLVTLLSKVTEGWTSSCPEYIFCISEQFKNNFKYWYCYFERLQFENFLLWHSLVIVE